MKEIWDKYNIKTIYRSTTEDIIKNFYIPLLKHSNKYLRTSGYFSSKSLAVAAIGFYEFAKRRGKYKLIVGEIINKDKIIEQVNNLDDIKEELIEDFGEMKLPDVFLDKHLKLLGWMLREGLLEIKIAISVDGDDWFEHAKEGLFSDGTGEWIGFLGSNNETGTGWKRQSNSFAVTNSWDALPENTDEMKNEFDARWNSNGEVYKGFIYIDIVEAIKRDLVRGAPVDLDDLDLEEEYKKEGLDIGSEDDLPPPEPEENDHIDGDKKFSLRPHQEEAINYWKSKNYITIFEMATASGKTFTSLRALRELDEKMVHFILAPKDEILNQWEKEIKQEFNDIEEKIISSASDKSHWKKRLKLNAKTKDKQRKKCFILVSFDSARRPGFLEELEKFGDDCSIIIDEVHNIGTRENLKILEKAENFKYRLGLSATPERGEWKGGDPEIREYFKIDDENPTYRYTLENAMRDKQLCKYNYFLFDCTLTEDEMESYRDYSESIGEALGRIKQDHHVQGWSFPQIVRRYGGEHGLSGFINQRTTVLKKASEKIPILEGVLDMMEKDNKKGFLYCEDEEHLVEMTRVLEGKRIRYRRITGEENPEDRKDALDVFRKEQNTFVLLAKRILDEGIDIPVCDVAILLSNTQQERQFIQRRGRVLRPAHRKNCRFDNNQPAEKSSSCDQDCKLSADIYDIMIIPSDSSEVQESELSILNSELDRVEEFAISAENKEEVMNRIENIRDTYAPVE